MITVKEALAAVQLAPDPPLTPLTDEEETQLGALDASVEAGLLRTWNGRIFDMKLPTGCVPPNVIAHLRALYETPDAGWTTGVFVSQVDAATGEPTEVRLVYAPTVFRVEVPAKAAVVYAPASGGARTARLLVRLYARGKPHLTLNAVEGYREKAGMPIAVEVLVDKDDAATLASAPLRRLLDLDCTVTAGDFKTRGAALAGGKADDWGALLIGGEAVTPIVDGYAARAFSALAEHFPHLDGAVFFDDGLARETRCTLPILGRRLVDQLGGRIYAPIYREALYADRELTETLRARGRLVYEPGMLFEHVPPARDERALEGDRLIYEARSAERCPHARIGFCTPPLWLSVAIVSSSAGRARLDRLVAEIYRQARAYAPGTVEVLVDDRAAAPSGERRQTLLERARGHFVVFLDDTAWPAYNYVERIVAAIEAKPAADCVRVRGALTVLDRTEVFEASCAYAESELVDGVRHRRAGRMNPVRRLLALHVGFRSVDFGEEIEYENGIAPLLKVEARAGDSVIYHDWFDGAVEQGSAA